jgi:hypothetical protein
MTNTLDDDKILELVTELISANERIIVLEEKLMQERFARRQAEQELLEVYGE